MQDSNKYSTSSHEAEGDILPNKLNITDKILLGKAEAGGFLKASIMLRAD